LAVFAVNCLKSPIQNPAKKRSGRLRSLAVTVSVAVLYGAAAGGVSVADETAAPADVEFFEKQVRPLLVEHCYECHSATKAKGNLRLDAAESWLRGGDSGPAVVPGKPDESLLVSAINRDGLEMPPAGKLSDEAISLLESWVKRGAPAPRQATSPGPTPTQRTIDIEAGRKFWAYQAVHAGAIPDVAPGPWSAHPVDRFLLAKLAEAGLQPSQPAERGILVRRLYFDLWGLPPTPEDLAAAEADSSPAWYENLVDRLLASPRFGERWARHWLDLVRYAESVTLRGFILPNAWRYRDYVIETFNQDRPYFQFLREQIAGDLLPASSLPDQQRQLIATTFLTLGNTNLEEQDKRQLEMDVVDEQLDVIGKALLAQTIGCARCHDHKFDPIPAHDYYALAGILRNTQMLEHANVSKWIDVPLPAPADEEARYAQHDAAVAAIETDIAATTKRIATLQDARGGDVVSLASLPGIVVDDSQATKVGLWQASTSNKPYVGSGYIHDADQDKGEKTVTFVPALPRNGRYEIRLAYTPGTNRAADVPVTVFSADGEKQLRIDMRERPPIDGNFVSLGNFRCETAGQSFVLVANEGTEGHVVVDAVQFLPADEELTVADGTNEGSEAASLQNSRELLAEKDKLKQLQAQLKELQKAPPRPQVMSVRERAEIHDSPIHLRGSVHTLGEVVPRGFLQVVAPAPAAPLPSEQSGRVELADWIASPENPLTARVFVNRVWHWLFGQGLVRTVDNFGTTGETPSHPELLDHLAARFQTEGGSLKQLIRYLVTSQAYRQDSHSREAARAIDPENRLLWRQNRQRLEAECLRDTLLSISGRLDLTPGGATIRAGTKADYDYIDDGARRSIYLPVLRNALPEVFEVFDFADPSLVVGRRNASTVAPQALFLMNDPFVRQQAEAAAHGLLSAGLADEGQRMQRAFAQALGRSPTAAEYEVVRRTLSAPPRNAAERERVWGDVYQMLFSSIDFRYRD